MFKNEKTDSTATEMNKRIVTDKEILGASRKEQLTLWHFRRNTEMEETLVIKE